MTLDPSALMGAFETHSVEEIRASLNAGLDPNEPIEGKTPLRWLTEMYARSDRFPACIRLLLDGGAVPNDPAVTPVLLNDTRALAAALDADPSLIYHRTTLVSAFTPLEGATLLHVAAEYGHLNSARLLIQRGADVDAAAAVDTHGLNGHTPLFHTVNSHANRSAPLMRLLLESGARVDVRLPGLVWGRGFEWETVFFDVTPISYAQLGLMPQVHRSEHDIYANLTALLQATGRTVPLLDNVPNRYLRPRGQP